MGHPFMKSKGSKPKTGVIKSCLTCSTEFYIKLCQASKKYCSQKCYKREHLKGRIGSEGQRAAMRLRKGILHPRWVKDRTIILENNRLRQVKEVVDWRLSVFHRDDFTCQECGIKGGKLEAHHIKPWRDYRELRHDINNGITLCRDCHRKTTFKEYQFIGKYSQKILTKL